MAASDNISDQTCLKVGHVLLLSACIFATLGGPLFAQESPYSFTRGFPANDETIKKAQDATDLRRAIEAYKFYFPTVATEAVIQQFKPHGAIPNMSEKYPDRKGLTNISTE